MKKKTLKALKGSIEKWKNILKKKEVDLGNKNCPLCKLFIKDDCKGCPVAVAVKNTGCDGTPYDDWVEHCLEKTNDDWYCWERTIGNKKSKKAAKAMLKFLKSLLPKDK